MEKGEWRFQIRFSHISNMESIRAQSPKVLWFKGIWFTEATPKFSFITWIAIHNRLSTGDRILRWNPQVISTWWLCKSATESRDHMFFECWYSKEVWCGTIGGLAGNRSLCQWCHVIQALVNGFQERTVTFLLRYCFQAATYAIWHERNVRRVGDPWDIVSKLRLMRYGMREM